MMNAKHTPGPWRVTHNGEGYPEIHGSEATDWGTEARHHWIATLLPCPSNLYRDGIHRTTDGMAEREANARLIACAPDLLDALRDVMRWIDSPPQGIGERIDRDKAHNRARSLIARAEGRA